MKTKLCHQIPEYKIKLEQTGIDRFTVTYFLEVKKGLTYGDACSAYGQAIMHALSCDGIVDNREKGER